MRNSNKKPNPLPEDEGQDGEVNSVPADAGNNSPVSPLSDAVASSPVPAADVVNPTGDPFSPNNLLLSQNFSELTPTRRLLTILRVGKPVKEGFVRASADPKHTIYASIIELKDESNETYFVPMGLRDALKSDPCYKIASLTLDTDRDGTPFFWKVDVPDPSGKKQPWISSMQECLEAAKTKWVRVGWLKSTRAYECRVAEIQAVPVFQTESMQELLNIAFKGKIITDLDHPVVKRLFGKE